MFKRFYPKEYLNSIYEIDYNKLKKMGIDSLIFDLDNTIVPFDVPEPDDKIISFFNELGKEFNISLLSNNNEKRVTLFNKSLGLPAVHKAGKPLSKGITKALQLMNATISTTALIGDQAFTDVWCGNRINMYTILVKPISDKDEFSVRLKRGAERIVINAYLKTLEKQD